MEVFLTQHAVGQGSMMSGLLTISGGQFHWVYDCGSNQPEALRREIATVSARGNVDCLFLSHLDSDHVNGIDQLLMATGVTEVVLPYLNDFDRLIATADDDARGALSGGFLTFLSDIEGWFGARGVERVTYITPRNDDGEDGGIPELPRFDGDGEGPIRPKWWQPDEGRSTPAGDSPSRGEGPVVQHLETTALLHLHAGGMLNWLLLPYAHRPSDAQLQAFRQAIHSEFGPEYRTLVKAMLTDPARRKKLRECYDLIWSDHNLVSMALYAGPTVSERWEAKCWLSPRFWRYPWWVHPDRNTVGWLGTGDMHLNGRRRREAMLKHYQHVLDKINVFILPHHGSHHNFHASLLDAMPNMVQCVAAAGPNGYGHPSGAVKQAVQSAGRAFALVSDKGRSTLQWHVRRR